MSPAPATKHQRVSFRLAGEFSNFLKSYRCEGFTAPFDVRLPKNINDPDSRIHTVVQPDLCVICDPRKIDDAGCSGAPDLIVEILSPSTSKKDLTIKHSLYEEHGVKEYWVIYPGDQIVEIFLLSESTGKYERGTKYVAQDEIHSHVLTGFSVKSDDIFID